MNRIEPSARCSSARARCCGLALAKARSRQLWQSMAALVLGWAFAIPALALDVSGLIDSNTVWSITDSPILVTGTVTVQNGASLSIDAGVQVRFAPSTELVIASGSLQAVGSPAEPVVFESANPSPNAGDWGPIEIQDNTDDQLTRIDGAVIRHGKGVVLTKASPTISGVLFSENQGPAIQSDLWSSPRGVGLVAENNDLNGILIPEGTITATVRWSLVGIPYVVAQGSLVIGLPPLTVTPTSLDLAEGQQANLTIHLAKPAPAGGLSLDLASSEPGVASTPGSVSIPAGSTQATVAVSGVTSGTSIINVSKLELGAVSVLVTVRPPVAITLTPANATMSVGQSLPLTIHLSEPASAPGAVVNLASVPSGLVDVPATALINAGEVSVTVNATGQTQGTGELVASKPGYLSGSSTIEVRDRALSFSPIGLLPPHSSRSLTLNLSEPAPVGGLLVSLESTAASVVWVPASVSIAEGSTTATVQVTTGSEGEASISASAAGFQPASTLVVVLGITLTLEGDSTIPQGLSSDWSLRLSKPAPAGGLMVNLSSTAPNVASVSPQMLTVPAGQTSAVNQIVVTGIEAGTLADITAESGGEFTTSKTVNVQQAPTLHFSQTSVVIGSRTRREISVQRRLGGVPLVAGRSLSVSLTSSNPGVTSIPSAVSIPAGQSSITVAIGVFEGATASIQISADALGYMAPPPLEILVAEPEIRVYGLAGVRGVGAVRNGVYLDLYVPSCSDECLALSDIAVQLGTSNEDPAGIISGIYSDESGDSQIAQLTIPAGRRISSDHNGNIMYGFIGTPTQVGSYRISTQIPGQQAALSDVQEVTDSFLLAFSLQPITVAQGMESRAVRVQQFLANYDEFRAINPVTVTLAISDANKVMVPVSVEIPAGEYEAVLPIVGIEETTNPVDVTATAPGYAPPESNLEISVEQAQLDFYLETYLQLGSPRNRLELYWEYDPKGGEQQTFSMDRAVTVDIIDQSPAGIVSGVYADATGPTLAAPLVLRAGQHVLTDNSGNQRSIYIGAPNAGGSYRVSVSVVGMGTWVSELIDVIGGEPQLVVNSNYVLGSGFRGNGLQLRRSGFALEQPLTFDITSATPGVILVPEEITIPAGSNEVLVPVVGNSLGSSTLTFSARNLGMSISSNISVVDPAIQFIGLQGTRGVGGQRDEFTVGWRIPGTFEEQVPIAPRSVSLEVIGGTGGIFASVTGPATLSSLVIPAESTVPLNASGDTVYAYVGTQSVANSSYLVRATVSGLGSWDSPAQQIVQPTFRFSETIHALGFGLASSTVRIQRRLNSGVEPVAADLAIAIGCTAESICSTPNSVVIPAGEFEVVVPISGIGLGSSQLRSVSAGLQFSPSTVDVRVIRPLLELLDVPSQLRIGEAREVGLRLRVPGSLQLYQPTIAPLTVALSSAFPGVAAVANSVVIAAGSGVSTAMVQGLGVGQSSITASAPNVMSSTSAAIWVAE
ncbi:MAG: hypothetical protein AB7E72_20335 [Lysobacterales bacterium]